MTVLHSTCIRLFVFMLLVFSTDSKTLPDAVPGHLRQWNILMLGAKPSTPDSYLCSAYPVDFDESYIYKFEALANVSTAHHMLLYGCDGEEQPHQGPVWGCPGMCKGRGQTIMFAWAKNAQPTVLPKDVGLKLGKKTSIKTLVLQVHYVNPLPANAKPDTSGLKLYITDKRPQYKAGIFLMAGNYFAIPPHSSAYPVDISCQYKKSHTLVPFAYRTHSHGLGKVITGYQYNGSYHEIGKGNPQWPQAFYPVKSYVEIKKNDMLAARCTYDSSKVSKTTYVGATGNDEMCNFYIMYYTDSDASDDSLGCPFNSLPRLTGDHFPDDVSVPLPHNAMLEEEALGHHHHHGGMVPTLNVKDAHNDKSQPQEEKHKEIHIEKKLVYQPSWPADPLDIGQVGGVSTDKDGNVYIFHRANRQWNMNSFDFDDNFQYPNAPIESDVIMVLDKDGKILKKFGKKRFFMPHGMTVDLEGNMFVTDVALHQVFKLRKNDSQPILTLGHRFKHSSEDTSYFCKPADVAVMSTGEFFVADGYCNGWVKKFSKDGKLIKAWGKKNTRLSSNQEANVFEIVHSVAVSERDKMVCAADRENGRIQCFDLDGNFKHIIKHKEFGSKLFAIDYSPRHGGVLYAVNGPSYDRSSLVQGFTLDMKNGALIDTWNLPQGLKKPHDVCVDAISDSVYVGELDPSAVWKLTRMSSEEAKKVFVDLNHGHDHDDHDADGDHALSDASKEDSSKESSVTPNTTAKASSSHTNSSSAESLKAEVATTGLSASMIMGMVLVIPVLVMLVVVLTLRSYRAGKLTFLTGGGKSNRRIFNMQNILGNSHKGFDPLSTEESDHDLDPNDSDHEEYSAPRKSKT